MALSLITPCIPTWVRIAPPVTTTPQVPAQLMSVVYVVNLANPFSAENINREALDRYQFHIDTPGLKAAYHWNCVGCHEEMDGPTDCQDCHARTPDGDDFYHHDAKGLSAAGKGGH
jgi:hypothetical protein